MTAADLADVADIDATVESDHYLHINREGEGIAVRWIIEPRPLRQARVHRPRMNDDVVFTIRQIINQIEQGIAVVAEHDQQIMAFAAARPDLEAETMRLMDLRVDFDSRREGLGSALLFYIVQEARKLGLRAVTAHVASDNFPAVQLLAKLNFELAGLDTHFKSNHDLVKDSVSLFWYLPLG
ncbi:MAG: GNAT family N-acetyltransferase [Tepidisphaeraceae bacterium]